MAAKMASKPASNISSRNRTLHFYMLTLKQINGSIKKKVIYENTSWETEFYESEKV